MAEQVITRRKAVKYLGIVAGTAAGREFLAWWLPSAAASTPNTVSMAGMHQAAPAHAEPTSPYVPQFFKPEEFETVQILTEMIIPNDGTPGAKEARVADYVDFVVFSAAEFQPSLQNHWSSGLVWLDKASREKYGQPFRFISARERETQLTDMSLPERDPNAKHPGFDFYRLVKEMTVEAFYTSHVGLIDVLQYQGLAYLSEFPGCTHPEHQT